MVPPEPPCPTPIPVEGDVQIFADPECTQYATGAAVETVYARINEPWGFNEEWGVGGPSGPELNCVGPTEELPDDAYYVQWFIDWQSDPYSDPFTPGQVVELHNPYPYEMDNPTTVFTKQ